MAAEAQIRLELSSRSRVGVEALGFGGASFKHRGHHFIRIPGRPRRTCDRQIW